MFDNNQESCLLSLLINHDVYGREVEIFETSNEGMVHLLTSVLINETVTSADPINPPLAGLWQESV